MILDRLFLKRPARQFESVCGCESNGGKTGKVATWVESQVAWLPTQVEMPGGALGFDPADGRGPPSITLSAQGITAQMGRDKTGEFGCYLDTAGYVTIARQGFPLERLPDPERNASVRVQRRALFMLRDATLDGPVGVYQAPRMVNNRPNGLELWQCDRSGARKVYSQPKGNPQGLTATTPRPLSGAWSATGGENAGFFARVARAFSLGVAPYRHLFIFGAPDARGNLQAWALDTSSSRVTQLTADPDSVFAGLAFWRQGRRWWTCVGVEGRGGVPTGIRTYYEPSDGATPWTRGDDYDVSRSSLLAFSDPGGAQSPEVSAPLEKTGEQLITWTVGDRAGAIAGGFACGMKGAVCAAILGDPESARVIGPLDDHGNIVLDYPVAEPEVVVNPDGRTWTVIYERQAAPTTSWAQWNPELRQLGPIAPEDFA